MKNTTLICSLLFLVGLTYSCSDELRIFEQYQEITNEAWEYENTPSFEVAIQDTSLRYNVMVNVRHTDSYKFSNMYVNVYTTLPSGKKLENLVNLPFADKKGKWYGNTSGNIVSQQVPIQQNAIFPEIGTYTFTVEQHMRQNPLSSIMDVGLRVEKVPKQ